MSARVHADHRQAGRAARLLGLMTALLLGACSKSPGEASPDPQGAKLAAPSAPSAPSGARANAPTPSASAASAGSVASAGGDTLAGPSLVGPVLADDQLRMLKAPPGDDVAAILKAERARQAALGRSVIVYAGAKWCEPCQHFHQAAAAGKLDKAFPKLTIVEFDVDEDGERLKRAGYHSQYIPLFVVPDADGHATDKRMEGSVKGDGAVDEIVPRLRRILG